MTLKTFKETMKKYLTQMLTEINENPKAIENYKQEFLLKVIFAHSFLPDFKMNLPEGEPPFKPAAEPMGMTPTNMFSEARRMYVFTRNDLSAIKRESLFISLLEGVHPDEAKILIAMKDQKLSKLYPKITHKLVSDAGIIPAPVAKEKKVVAKK
jgi:hypothetical protein